MKCLILLNTIERVRDFVAAASLLEADVTLTSGRYVVDGKSIMGIFSLNLTDVILMEIDGCSVEYAKECLMQLQPFVV